MKNYTCCACGDDFEEGEVEEVIGGMEGKLDFMCHRCFKEHFPDLFADLSYSPYVEYAAPDDED